MPKLPRFYVGQRVIAIVDGQNGLFKRGDTFTVTGVFKMCECDYYSITVGIQTPFKHHCGLCNKRHIVATNGELLTGEIRFAPIQEDFQPIAFERINENEKVCVN